MSTEEQLTVIEKILQAVEQDDFILPTMPSVAINIRKLLDDPNVSADQIVSVLSSDPVISAQIIRSANSAAFADMPQVLNVREAALRLGYRQLHNLVISITMNRMFNSNNPVFNQHMKHIWEHSRKVAAVSYVLASRQPNLSPDQAMLAGLMHNIGMLPLYLYIENNHVQIDDDTLSTLIRKTHRTIGAKLLKSWNFSQEIIAAVAEHEDFHRESSKAPQPDYADVVIFANLQVSSRVIAVTWDNITAIQRLGMDKEDCRTFLERNSEHIEHVEVLLGMKPKAKPSFSNIVAQPNELARYAASSQVALASSTKENKGLLSFLSRLWR